MKETGHTIKCLFSFENLEVKQIGNTHGLGVSRARVDLIK